MPMRNGQYYDAMEFIDVYKYDIYRGVETEVREAAVEELKSNIADRSVAAEIDVLKRTFGCLRCQCVYKAAVAYLCHRCDSAIGQKKQKDETDEAANDRQTHGDEAYSRRRS